MSPREVRAVADLPPAKQAELTATASAEADRIELRDQYTTAIQRLSDIINNGATFTATQTRDAVIDLARIQRRMLRVLGRMVGAV